MAKKLNAFTDADAKRIANAVLRVEGKTRGLRQPAESQGRAAGPYIFLTPGGGIAARSGTTAGSASCTQYNLIGTTLTSASVSYTVYNIFGTAIAGGAYIIAAQINGLWVAIAEDC